MAITEPDTGSDSASIRTTAVLDGDEYVLNGEKIYVTSGERSDAVVVWATLDRSLGRAAIKSFVVPKGTPGMTVERLEHKLGIRASDTAAIRFEDCRVPGGEPARLARRRRQPGLRRGDGDLRQHPPAGRRDGGRLRQGRARPDPRPARAGGRDASTTTGRPWSRAPRPRSSCRWRPTGRARGCSCSRPPGWPTTGKANAMEASMAKAKAGRVGLRRHPVVRRALRLGRLQRGRAAGEVGPRLQDPRHLRGHPADPAADRRPSGARALQRRAEVAARTATRATAGEPG